jgi:hypothetical protein
MTETPYPEGGTTRASEELKATAEQATAKVAREVRAGIAEGTAEVREQAAARTEEAKQGFAREMSAAARALDAASREMAGHPLQQGLLREASRGVAGMADALHGRSVGELVANVAEFGRRNPVAFLGGATLAGFALARLATASAPGNSAGETAGEWPEARPAPIDAPMFNEGVEP